MLKFSNSFSLFKCLKVILVNFNIFRKAKRTSAIDPRVCSLFKTRLSFNKLTGWFCSELFAFLFADSGFESVEQLFVEEEKTEKKLQNFQ